MEGDLSEKGVADLLSRARVAISATEDLEALEQCRRGYLGRKSELYKALQGLGTLSENIKRTRGKYLNNARAELNEHFQARQAMLLEANNTQADAVDISMPPRTRYIGSAHPLSLSMRRIQDLLTRVGFDVVEGYEVEDEYHNFDALNIPADHPARAMHDTMYLNTARTKNRLLLRSHTSPAQIRTLRARKPPLRIISPGRVYRCDLDATHTPMFHQVEGLWVARDINFSDLRGLLIEFLRHFFDHYTQDFSVRFRASYFPFTEPSAEVDIACVRCSGKGCRICKQSGWLEVMGCGMVHPNVLREVGLDENEWNGVAFGMGVERLSMLYYGIDDLRLFFENSPRFLAQFLGRAR